MFFTIFGISLEIDIQYITIIDLPGKYKILCGRDDPKGGIYAPSLGGVFEYELTPGYDYVVMEVEPNNRLKPIFNSKGGISFIHIYKHQIDQFLRIN